MKTTNIKAQIKRLSPGIILCAALAFIASIISKYDFGLGSTTIALILGFIAGNTIKYKPLSPGINTVEKKILPFAIAVLGIQLNLLDLKALGSQAILLILLIVPSTILLSILIGKLFGLSRNQAILLGTGNAICGSSAIAGVNKVIKARQDEVGLSIAAVNLMGTIGLFCFPITLKLLNFTHEQTGFSLGGSLQAVGQVVAAAFGMSDDIGKTAIIIKMGRVLMLGPVVIIISLLANRSKKKADDNIKVSIPIPLFIIGFFAMSLLATFVLSDQNTISSIKHIGKILLNIAMAGIGMRIVFSDLLVNGPKILLVEIVIGLIMFISTAALSLYLV